MLEVGLGVKGEEAHVLLAEIPDLAPAFADHRVPAALARLARAVTRHVDPFRAGIGDQPEQPVAVRHQPHPGVPAELGGGGRRGRLYPVPVHADAHAQILQDLPVRLAAAELVVGDDLLRAGMDDVELDLPDRAVGRGLELEHRVALARVQPVLQHPGAAAVGRPGVVGKDQATPDEILHLGVEPPDHRFPRHAPSPPCRDAPMCRNAGPV